MNITILKKAQCGKVSTPEKETLTYNIGHCGDKYYFRVTDNVGGGFFSHEWISLGDITECLPADSNFNATALKRLLNPRISTMQINSLNCSWLRGLEQSSVTFGIDISKLVYVELKISEYFDCFSSIIERNNTVTSKVDCSQFNRITKASTEGVLS